MKNIDLKSVLSIYLNTIPLIVEKYAFFIIKLLDNTDKRNQNTVGNLIKHLIKT